MSQEERLRENVARLVRAAYGPSARPDAQAHADLLRRLRGTVRERHAWADFPDGAVIVISAVLLAMVVWIGWHCALPRGACLTSPSSIVAAGWVVLNLAALPVASVVILKSRGETRRETGFLPKTWFLGSKKEK